LPKKTQNTICIDFDGVIVDYSQGYQGPGIFGELIPGARDSICALKAQGWKVIIHTSRYEIPLVSNHLKSVKVPFDEINKNSDVILGMTAAKPVADIYLDDRAVEYNHEKGGWDKALKDIDNLMKRKGVLAYRK
jgi:hypothetical protein